MEKIAYDTLSLWRDEGSRQIPQNFEVFRSLVVQAKDYLERGNYNMAAIYGDIASEYASLNQNCGLFVSPKLENLLLTIGKEALPSNSHRSEARPLHRMPKNSMHQLWRKYRDFSKCRRYLRKYRAKKNGSLYFVICWGSTL